MSQEVKDDFCKLCNNSCNDKDGYAGYEGAFKCMASGNNDRVGFVKQDTADKVVSKSKKDDYKLLCKDGKTKGKLYIMASSETKLQKTVRNGQFQCLAKFLLKHGKQNPSLQLKRSYQK